MRQGCAIPRPAGRHHTAGPHPAAALVLCWLACACLCNNAAAFEGRVVDALSGDAIAGAVVRTAELVEISDATGAFSLDAEAGARVEVYSEVGSAVWTAPEAGGRLALLRVLPDSIATVSEGGWGTPLERAYRREVAHPVRLPSQVSGPNLVTVPATLPTSIRVAMHVDSDCSRPVDRIVEVALEDYVEGVVISEIGVFRRVEGGPVSALESFKTFAIAARSYVLWWYFRDPDADAHINNTACNQRFEETHDATIRQAVDATAGMIMVAAHDHSLLDKLEYAASCGRHGSRPEYQEALVPDITGEVACVGSWCGHNTCAAHEVNPDVPEEGRCLVRGICQWGSVERSMGGDSWQEIIEHYQPNVNVVAMGATPASRIVGYIRYDDVITGSPAASLSVFLDTGESTTTNTSGYFEFSGVEAGERVVTISGRDITDLVVVKDVVEATTAWVMAAVVRRGDGDTGVDVDGGGPESDTADATDATDVPGSDVTDSPDGENATDVPSDVAADVDAVPGDVAAPDAADSRTGSTPDRGASGPPARTSTVPTGGSRTTVGGACATALTPTRTQGIGSAFFLTALLLSRRRRHRGRTGETHGKRS